MSKRPKPRIEPYDMWGCHTCADPKGMDAMTFDEMKAHMRDAHNVDVSTVKARREMIAHVDARDYFTSDYMFTFAGPPEVILYHNVRCLRAKDDMMRYA